VIFLLMKDAIKKCTNCNEVKNLNGFYKKSKGTCGVDSKCKQCVLKSKHHHYIFKLRAKSGEIILIENEADSIPEKAVQLFIKTQEKEL
jgi:hypothetical protein